jgi:hypothetical protein
MRCDRVFKPNRENGPNGRTVLDLPVRLILNLPVLLRIHHDNRRGRVHPHAEQIGG